MIKSFGDKKTERIFRRIYVKSIPMQVAQLAYRKLLIIHSVEHVEELRIPPGSRLEKLSGDSLAFGAFESTSNGE